MKVAYTRKTTKKTPSTGVKKKARRATTRKPKNGKMKRTYTA